LSNISFDSRSS